MIHTWIVVVAAVCYLGLLFAIAWMGDRRAERRRSLIANPYVYALSMAVYCTAWTFYGSVGRAATAGVAFLPVYLGPTLAAALGWMLLRKIVRIAKQERITSIADFVASRYGKSRGLGALVTVIAVVGITPYIALQLKAVSSSFLLLTHGVSGEPGDDPGLAATSAGVALLLGIFAILFGTRHLDLTEHHEGLVLAIAFESVVKLVAFLAVGAWVVYGLEGSLGDLFARVAANPDLQALTTFQITWGNWLWVLALSFGAILFLPRQFQMSVVENVDERHLNKSAWLFPLYLFAINLFVLPIAFSGRLRFPTGGIDADSFVLALPLAEGQSTLALLVFLGGLSASTGMVIVETVALSTMISNDLVLPLLLRSALGGSDPNLGARILFIRRLAILLILLLGQLYLLSAPAVESLVSLGLISFAAVAQLGPAFLGGLYWRGGTRRGALAGMTGGFLVWAYTLALPTAAGSGWLSTSFLEDGPFGVGWLRPHALFGLEGMSPIPHSIFWSLLINVGAYLAVSSLGVQSAVEYGQARRFVDVFRRRPESAEPEFWRPDTPVAAVRTLLERFLGVRRTTDALARYSQSRGLGPLAGSVFADAELLAFAERLLAGTTGAASARVALATVAREKELSVGEVMRLLDETSRVIATSRQLEEKSEELERASEDLRAANERLRELDRLKDDFLATMAHELRTPLTSIRAFTEILHDHPELDPAKRREFLDIVLRENERLTRLLSQVLDLAKIESGEGPGQLITIAPIEALEDAVASMSSQIEERGVRLEMSVSERLPEVVADRDRILQVLVNLISNALKFCEPGGWIGVSATEREGRVEIAVSDDGPGVPTGERENVFDRFRQVSRPVAGRTYGTGLGLSICREIVVRHGGRIWVEESVRGGARFAFDLPVATVGTADRPAV
ncbi:MAG: histidine kinase [Acidobacteria bacterium]|nr:histidine kinase [Acidobacteriota bacterium]MCB9378937.1 histidine kinase [Holophagales bacterium]